MHARLWLPVLVVVAALAAGFGGCRSDSRSAGGAPAKTPTAPPRRAFTLFVTTEIRGTTEPCGCTSDPLGDIARTAALVEAARAGGQPVLYIDGGSLLYTARTLPKRRAYQEKLKAKLLVRTVASEMDAQAIGLGPYDLAAGAAAVAPPREAANVPAAARVPLAPPKVVKVGGARVGVFGVVAPEAVASFGIHARPAAPAAAKAVAKLRKGGADVVIALASMTRKEARALARKVPGIDIVVVGEDAPDPDRVENAPQRVGHTWLVRPANRGQVVTRLDITLRGGGPLADAIGKARAAVATAKLAKRIGALRTQLAGWAKDPHADERFVATKRKELAGLVAERAALKKSPLRIPSQGSYFVMRQIPVAKKLACDTRVEAEKIAYDKKVGRANVKAVKDVKPPPAAKGKPHYVGVGECVYCHKKEVAFWRTTKHAHAWHILVAAGKQFNYDCIGCHVTGFSAPGGSNLSHNNKLRNVQCEVCHGPASLHVDANGHEKHSTLVLKPPPTRCRHCHTPEHSDTFQYQAYLRDVTGPGHGEKLHLELGKGPTAHALRRAALAKAGLKIGKGCSE